MDRWTLESEEIEEIRVAKRMVSSAESLAVRGWLVRRVGRRKKGSAAAP